MKKIEPLKEVPAAFSDIAQKVNELVRAMKPVKAGLGTKVTETEQDVTISATITAGQVAELAARIGRTFWVFYLGGADVAVTAGAINNVAYAGGTITAPANDDKVYIDATISGTTVTAVTVAAAASVPANTTTHVYKLLATVAVASSVATPTPVGWNFSEMQICAGQALWGGFGS